jgi:hypothetical protein
MKTKKELSFNSELAKALADKSSPDATGIIDTLKEAPDMYTDDFMKAKEITKKLPDAVPPKAKYIDASMLKPDIRGVDFDPAGTKTLHKSLSRAGKPVRDAVVQSQTKGKAFRGLMGLLGKAAPIAKIAGKAAGPLGFASDVLASDDLGAGENMELEKMKQEARQQRLDPEGTAKMAELKAKLAENAAKPLSGNDLIRKEATPMIKQLGGSADVNPRMAEKLLGEQDSPDYESGLDPVKEINRRKKLLGY